MDGISKGFLSVALQIAVLILVIVAIRYDSKTHDDSVQVETPLRELKVSHGFDLCDLPLLVAAQRQLSNEFHTEVELVPDAKLASAEDGSPSSVSEGRLQAAVVPFTVAIKAYAAGKSIRIIAGCGMEHLELVSQIGIQSRDLKGKTLGMLRNTNMEVFADDAVDGLKSLNIHPRYYENKLALFNAFGKGSIDLMTNVEAYASRAALGKKGNILWSTRHVWGERYPGCVLISSDTTIDNEREPLKGLISGMLRAQKIIQSNPKLAKEVANLYLDVNEFGSKSQLPVEPPQIDIRDETHFIIERSNSIMKMGDIKKAVDDGIFDFSLLGELANERPTLLTNEGVKPSQSNDEKN